jgi:hypothetical protein
MPATDTLGHLLELATLAPGDPLPFAVALWLREAAERHIETGESLEHLLGLRGGSRTAAYRLRKLRRDYHLRQAWSALDGSPWQRSVRLSEELIRFQSILWPRWRELQAPPEGCSQLRSALWRALKTRMLIPSTARHLHEICCG